MYVTNIKVARSIKGHKLDAKDSTWAMRTKYGDIKGSEVRNTHVRF